MTGLLLIVLSAASAQEPPAGDIVSPPIIALPLGSPPTGLQAPVPRPAGPARPADRPLMLSPDPTTLAGRLPPPLTLNDAVALALTTNRTLALAGASLLLAQGRTAEARAALNPTIGATLSDTQLDSGSAAQFGGQSIVLVKPNQKQLGIQATLPIDISGLLHTATDQARFQEIAARLDVNRTRNQIVLDVKSAFYDVLRAKALVAVATENLADTLTRLSDAQKRYGAGVVAYFDVIRAQTDVANAQQQLIQSRSNVSIAIATLNSTIGININAPTAVTDQGAVETPPGVAPPALTAPEPSGAPPPEEPPAGPLPVVFDPLNLGPGYDALVTEALRLRPDVLEADAGIAAARLGIRLARRSQLPTVGLSAGFSYAPDNGGFSPKTTSANAVISLNVPMFDGGFARARTQEARANVATAETNRRNAIDQVELELRQAYLILLQTRDRVAVANQALAQAREGFRLAQVRYNAGVAAQAGISPLLEVSDAQAALTQAENNQVNALYDYNNGRARLDKAIGRYAFISTGPGYKAPPALRELGTLDLTAPK